MDVEIRYSRPEAPPAGFVAELREVLEPRKRVNRAYLARRSIYEEGREVQIDKPGLGVELRGWFGRRYLDELGRELQAVMRGHFREWWSSTSNHLRSEIRDVGVLVFDRSGRS